MDQCNNKCPPTVVPRRPPNRCRGSVARRAAWGNNCNTYSSHKHSQLRDPLLQSLLAEGGGNVSATSRLLWATGVWRSNGSQRRQRKRLPTYIALAIDATLVIEQCNNKCLSNAVPRRPPGSGRGSVARRAALCATGSSLKTFLAAGSVVAIPLAVSWGNVSAASRRRLGLRQGDAATPRNGRQSGRAPNTMRARSKYAAGALQINNINLANTGAYRAGQPSCREGSPRNAAVPGR